MKTKGFAFAVGCLTVALMLPRYGRTASAPQRILPDAASFADVGAFATRHLVLDLTANFERRTLAGTAELRLERRDASAKELVLDTRDLTVKKVEAATGTNHWVSTEFNLDPAIAAFGKALRIVMPPNADRVRVTYATSPEARGLQWLTPAQTAGKRHPFLYSNPFAINARSFIPLQDLPGVRTTYEVILRTPLELVALMAAERLTNSAEKGVFRFRMPQPIPSYLISFAVGELTFKSTGPRTGIWAEPSVVETAAREFEDMERMLSAIESLYGPYRWDRYDLLVMPPALPFGGVENPRLTFMSPTIIAGDKSLVYALAHEIAHSWSGNLVNHATWPDLWLNEGVTTYIEWRVLEQLNGKDRADMQRALAVRELEEERAKISVPGDRALIPALNNRDPDDAYSSVPYFQGGLFLYFLEAKFGRESFDRFLRGWFDTHAFRSATTSEFLRLLHRELMERQPGRVTEAQIQEWLHSEVVPTFAVLPHSEAFITIERVRSAWLGGGSLDELVSAAKNWSVPEWKHFVEGLPRSLSRSQMSLLDDQFHLTSRNNFEISRVWLRLAIATRYDAADLALERFLMTVGRRVGILPLYRELEATSEGKARARAIFAKARDQYHPIVQASVDELLRSGE